MTELSYEHLLGRKFVYAKTDCFAVVRDFYRDNFELDIPNYARPHNFWDHGLNLYMEAFPENGFRVLREHPSRWLPGDAILCAIRSRVANHAAVFVERGRVLHHLVGRLSCVEDYRGLLRNTTVAVIRNDAVAEAVRPMLQQADLMEFLPHVLRSKLASVAPPAGGQE